MWRRTGAAPIAGVALAAWLMMLGSGECVCDNVIITRRWWGMVNVIEGPQWGGCYGRSAAARRVSLWLIRGLILNPFCCWFAIDPRTRVTDTGWRAWRQTHIHTRRHTASVLPSAMIIVLDKTRARKREKKVNVRGKWSFGFVSGFFSLFFWRWFGVGRVCVWRTKKLGVVYVICYCIAFWNAKCGSL